MTSTGIKGVGLVHFGTNNPLNAAYGLLEATSNFSLTTAAEVQTETGWAALSDDCAQQTLQSIATSKTLTLELTYQDISWEMLQHLFGEFAQTSASYEEPVGGVARVPSTGPYTVVAPDLIGANILEVGINALSRDNTWGERGVRTIVAAAPADATEVQFDDATGTFTFDADSAGMPFGWFGKASRTNIETIGVENGPLNFLELSYTGIICIEGAKAVNGVRIYIPRMKFTQNFSFDLGAETPAPVLTYDLLLADGKRSVVEFARRLA